MAYKQPRVPPFNEGTKLYDYIRELILFLKDFCLETWKAVRQIEDSGGGKTTLRDLGVTASAEEINQLEGMDSNVKEQIDSLGYSINQLGNSMVSWMQDVNRRLTELENK